jgi:hypothetical protein
MKNKMKNPTIKQVAFVIDKLKLVREQASQECALDMDETRVRNKEYDCGTVHCVGGWYAVANLNRKAIKNKFDEGHVAYGHIDYVDGANLMAKDLGFADHYELEDWANKNPKIWGNERGRFMFTDEFSYDNAGFDGVIAQWELVKQNLIWEQ